MKPFTTDKNRSIDDVIFKALLNLEFECSDVPTKFKIWGAFLELRAQITELENQREGLSQVIRDMITAPTERPTLGRALSENTKEVASEYLQ